MHTLRKADVSSKVSKILLLYLGVKQPWPFGRNNTETELRLLLQSTKTKLRHLDIKLFRSSEKTYKL